LPAAVLPSWSGNRPRADARHLRHRPPPLRQEWAQRNDPDRRPPCSWERGSQVACASVNSAPSRASQRAVSLQGCSSAGGEPGGSLLHGAGSPATSSSAPGADRAAAGGIILQPSRGVLRSLWPHRHSSSSRAAAAEAQARPHKRPQQRQERGAMLPAACSCRADGSAACCCQQQGASQLAGRGARPSDERASRPAPADDAVARRVGQRLQQLLLHAQAPGAAAGISNTALAGCALASCYRRVLAQQQAQPGLQAQLSHVAAERGPLHPSNAGSGGGWRLALGRRRPRSRL
jgi:hypothetical protein